MTTSLPYDGIRIVDLTQLEQGPSGTQVLADFGADVIKIERPDVGEIGRRQNPAEPTGFSAFWAANNRNKRSLSLDLKSGQGQDVFEKLVASADVVASNFRPGVMEKLGFGRDRLQELNPRIVVAYASGYGQTGPLVHAKGQDLAAQALGGLMSVTGNADSPPTPVGTYVVDYVAAMHFAQAIMIGLAARDRTGESQQVEACLLNASIAMQLQEASVFLNNKKSVGRPLRHSAHHRHSPLYGYYETADSKWISLVGEFFVDHPWARAAQALDMPDEYIEDPRLQDIESLSQHSTMITELLQFYIGRYYRDDVLQRFEKQGLLATPVRGYEEVFADEQVLHNKMIADVDIAGLGKRSLVGVPITLRDTPVDPARFAPPRVGEHNDDLLDELGFGVEERQVMRENGSVGNENERRSAGLGDAW